MCFIWDGGTICSKQTNFQNVKKNLICLSDCFFFFIILVRQNIHAQNNVFLGYIDIDSTGK